MKLTKIIAVSAATFSLMACSSMEHHDHEHDHMHMHDSVAGNYLGTLPCADCEGIKTLISLNDDMSFKKQQIYLKSQNSATFESTGAYSVNEDTHVITLKGAKEVSNYLLKDGTLIMTNQKGDMPEGPMASMYVLKKQ